MERAIVEPMTQRSRAFFDEVFRRYLAASSVTFATAGVGFLVVLLVARHYGSDGLGQLSIALSLLDQGLVLTTSGLHVHALQRSAAVPEESGRLLVETTILRLWGALAVWPLLMLLVLFVPGLEGALALVLVLGGAVLARAVTPYWYPQARHQTLLYVLARLAVQVVNLVVVLLAAALGLGLWAVAAGRVAGELVAAAWLLRWTTTRLRVPVLRARARALAEMLRVTVPITGSHALRSLAIGLDPVIVAIFVSDALVGYFSAAYRVFVIAILLGTTYLVIVVPRLAEAATRGAEALRRELASSHRRILPAAALCWIGLALFGGGALRLLFGDGFEAAGGTLSLLGLAAVLNLVNRHYRHVLLILGCQNVDLVWTAVATACHLVAKLALVPLIGIAGAGLGAVLGETVLSVTLFLAMKSALSRHASRGPGLSR